MKVLITGGGGFIGSHLAERQLNNGHEVRVIDLHPVRSPARPPRFEAIEGDIRDRGLMAEAVRGMDLVFHLASAHLSVATSDRDYWKTNVEATRSLVDLCARAGVKRLVHCSSVGVYGEITDPPASEDSPCRPDLVYEKTKLAAEQELWKFYRETRYPISVIRPVWVYGPGCPRTAKLFRTIRKRRFVMAGDGKALRHCVYISDLLDAFDLGAGEPAAVGEAFIIGDGGAVTVERLVTEIASVMGVPPPSIKLPLALLRPVCTVAETAFKLGGREPPLSRRTLKFFTNNTSFDISKARRLLKYSPKMTLADGLKETYASLVRDRLL